MSDSAFPGRGGPWPALGEPGGPSELPLGKSLPKPSLLLSVPRGTRGLPGSVTCPLSSQNRLHSQQALRGSSRETLCPTPWLLWELKIINGEPFAFGFDKCVTVTVSRPGARPLLAKSARAPPRGGGGGAGGVAHRAGVSNLWPAGHVRPSMAESEARHKIINALKTCHRLKHREPHHLPHLPRALSLGGIF